MGHCFSVSSSEIHEENEFSDRNTMVCYGEEFGSGGDDRPSGSVWSIQGSKGLNQDAAVLCLVKASLLLTFKNHHSQSNDEISKWEDACLGAFRLIDRELLLQTFDCSFSGTTAVITIRQGDDLVLANLGDSRAVLGTVAENREVRAVQLTTDLKPGIPREEERITACNGRVFALKAEPFNPRVWLPNRDIPGLAMSRAFGDFVLKDYGIIAVPEVSHHRLTPDDQFLVLATDGVWDVLSNDEVVSIVRSSERKPAAAAKSVAETAKAC